MVCESRFRHADLLHNGDLMVNAQDVKGFAGQKASVWAVACVMFRDKATFLFFSASLLAGQVPDTCTACVATCRYELDRDTGAAIVVTYTRTAGSDTNVSVLVRVRMFC